MISHLKEKGLVQAPLICLMTDYGPHRAWIAPNVDAYVVSNEGMAAQMVVWGVPKEKIHLRVFRWRTCFQQGGQVRPAAGVRPPAEPAHGPFHGGFLRRDEHPLHL